MRAVRPGLVDEKDPHHFGEREGGDGEEHAAQSHQRQSEDEGGEHPDRDTEHDPDDQRRNEAEQRLSGTTRVEVNAASDAMPNWARLSCPANSTA